MYKVIIVDDETSASNFIRQIIEKKCPEYEVSAIAEDGKEAIQEIKINKPDVLISDIRMPIMDGIQLINTVNELYPDIKIVLVTGHPEFEYAQQAIRAGVSEYLLKPVKPKELVYIMNKLALDLAEQYHTKCIKVFQEMVSEQGEITSEEVSNYFEGGKYYAVFIRKKGLQKRFSKQNGVPIYSLSNEQLFLYGRDEMESLYLIHEKYLSFESLEELTQRIIKRFDDVNSYITCIKYDKAFNMSDCSKVVKELYRQMDLEIVIGKNKSISIENCGESVKISDDKEKLLNERIEYYIKYKEMRKIENTIDELFEIWKKDERNQMYIEKQINHIIYMLSSAYGNEEKLEEITFILDDAFSYASSLDELKNVVLQTFGIISPDLGADFTDDNEELFHNILAYLESHMSDEITLNGICRSFGISHTSLSRLFRSKKQCSFSSYMMHMRINEAKRTMKRENDVFIKDVAEQVGYKDQFYFSRIFRSIVGMSPSEYLEKC